ncbi:hypothetical protein [Mycolicibacterium smegmatis]|uniref:hypothetical protein n=1 Tax=Mycolicibacterium smegmatis TaxID=1772 RepID=UPI001EFBDE8D|nr:hypothetical protein [Mycolicibacterium smegmatis]ULN33409.1 hypothetical protein KZ781_21560 [Mycolicibacterium smegmatis]
MGTSFQPAHAGQANSDVTYSCSRPKGKAGAVAWYRDVMGLSNVGIGLVTKATNDRTLPSYKISGAIWYSTVDLYNFIQGMRRTSPSEKWYER